MAKALGTTPEEERQPGLRNIASKIKGQVGLLFTNTPPSEVTAWFDDFRPLDFARSGTKATQTFTIPSGPIMQQHSEPPEPFPHNEEPQLRKLGLHTSMVRGVPTLQNPHTVCEEGKTLTPEQTQLLKLIGVKTVKFKVGLRAYWDRNTSQVTEVEGAMDADEEKGTEGTVDGEGGEDKEMSE